MKLEDLETKLGIANLGEEEKLALVKDIQANLPALKAEQRSLEAKTQANLVVEAIKKIKEGLEARFDELNGIVDVKVRDITSGKDGIDGKDGKNGVDGKDGVDGISITGPKGADGQDGEDGVGVQDAHIDFDGSLIITLTDGRELNVGEVVPMDVAEKIKIIGNGGGTSQSVLDAIAALQAVDATYGTMATQNADAVAITGGTINGATVGATTPAAGTFTTLTATTTNIQAAGANAGLTMLRNSDSANNSTRIFLDASGGIASIYNNANTIRFQTGATIGTSSGALQLNVAHTASAVNYVQVTGAATTASPTIDAAGSDATLALTLRGKGSNGSVILGTTFGTSFRSVGFSGATVVNYLQAQGSATTIAPVLSAQGSDTNISQVFQSKGTGAIDLAAGSSGINISNGGTVTAITGTAGGSYTTVPTFTISAPTTASGVQATGTAAMAQLTTVIAGGGTGYTVNDVLTFVGGTGTALTVTVTTVSSGVITAFTVTNAGTYTVLPTNPISVTGGTGSGATFNVTAWQVRLTAFTITNAGSGYVEQPTVTFSGGGGSGAAAYAVVGSGTVVKSIGSTMSFNTPAGESFRVEQSGSFGAGYWRAQGSAITPGLFASGANGIVGTGSSGVLQFAPGNTEQFRVSTTASAVNYVQVTGRATGNGPQISTQGSDTNANLELLSKGNGSVKFFTGTREQFRVVDTAGTIVNYATATGAATGASPTFSVAGTDTDIDLTLTPKGTGAIRFGTYTAGILTPTGYITVKDSGGTTRRLLVG